MTTKPKTVPELRFPGFGDSWQTSTIAELGKVVTGGTPNTSDSSLYGGDFMFVSPSDIGDARYVNSTTKTLTEAGHKTGRRIPKGSIVFVCIGSTIGKVAQVVAECTTNQQINAVVPDGNHDANFLLCVLDKEAAQIRLLAGKQAVPIINKSTFAAISVSIPPLPEQRKIAEFLTAVDGRIGQLSQKKALLEDYKKGVMQQLFTQALRFKDDHGNDFPEWEEKTLGDVAKLISGQHLDPEQYDDSGEGVPYFTGPSDFTSDPSKFTKWTKFSSKIAPPDSVLICVKGNGVGNLMYSTLPQVAMGRQLMGIRSESFSNVLLYQFLLTKTQQFVALGSGNLIPGLSRPDILTFAIPAPSLPEQTKIASFLTALDRKIESVAQQIRHTQAFKKGLLQQMFV